MKGCTLLGFEGSTLSGRLRLRHRRKNRRKMRRRTPTTTPTMIPTWLRLLLVASEALPRLPELPGCESDDVPLAEEGSPEETAPEPDFVDDSAPVADPEPDGSVVAVEFVLLSVTVTADVPVPMTTTDDDGGNAPDEPEDVVPDPPPPFEVAVAGIDAPIEPPTETPAESPFCTMTL